MKIWLALLCFACPAFSQMEEGLPKPPDTGWWAKAGTRKEGSVRVALLIGVGRHALERSTYMGWDLEYVEKDLADMQKMLEEEAGFNHVRVLSDQDATHSKIEGFLTAELPARITGGGNVLIIYFSGHGVVQDGERSWFTHFTDYKGERYSKLLTSSLLMQWIAALKARGDVKVGLIMDSCATSEKAPGQAPQELTLGDERLFASPQGAMTSASVFTQAVLSAVNSLKDKEQVRLADIFQLAYAELAGKNLTLPDHSSNDDDSIVLINRTGLEVTLRAVDSITPAREIKDAKLFYEDQEMGRTPYHVTELKPGRYPLLVDSPGYLNTRVVIDLDLQNSGGVYEIPLIPAYMVLAGRVQREDGSVPSGVKVEVLGSYAGWRKGFHTETVGLMPTGVFRHIVPPDADVKSIKITGLDEPLVIDVDYEKLDEESILLSGKNKITIYALDPIVLSGSTLAEGELQMDRASRMLYLEAQALAATGRVADCRSAAFTFMGVWQSVDDAATKATLEGRIRESLYVVFRSQMAEGKYDEGIDLSSTFLKEFPTDPGIREWHQRFTRENIPPDLRELLNEAADAVEKKDLKQAAMLFRKISAKQKELTPFYREKTLEWLRTIQEELFLENYSRMITAQKNGDMITAARYFEATEKLAPAAYAWTMKNLKPQFDAYIDNQPPVLTLTSPRGGSVMAPSAFFTIRGEVTDDKAVHRVTVNGMEVVLTGEDMKKQGFAHKVELDKGKNAFEIVAFDRRGHSVQTRAEVIFKKETVAEGFIYIKELTFTTGGAKHRVKIYRHEMTALEFVLVPGGKFTMGSPPEEMGREADEGPQREVTVEPFLLCRTEVPQAMWQRSMKAAPWSGKREAEANPLHPATYVSWEDCRAFCAKTGLRMPTEAEWEYACRAGTTTRFCFGNKDSMLKDHGWFQGNTMRKGKTAPQRIGNRKPNAFGLYDMHGNVWEWCMDTWHGDYAGAPADGSAWLDPPSEFRLLRGGSFSHTPARCRSAYRVRVKSDMKNSSIGFRPAFTLPQPKK